jgi:phosphopantothenoylcysteine decarboxylase/phosphopantothenate--cysteine ligase
MAAAVADYRPAVRKDSKIKKSGAPPEAIRLVENPDILGELSVRRARAGQVIVGFAAETDAELAAAEAKLARKACDLLVVNPVGSGIGFGTDDNEAMVLGADGTRTRVPPGPKEDLADVVWDLVAARLS